MGISVRRAEIKDADIIASNVLAMAIEGSGTELDTDTVHAGVRALFGKPDLGFYVVAEVDNEVAGSLVIVYEWSDWRNGAHWWIHSVYVRPEFRRQGVYSHMHTWVKEQVCSRDDAVSLRLSVNKHNDVARKTYENLGMIESLQVQYNQPDV